MGTTWDSRTIWEFKFSAFGFLDLTLTPGGFFLGGFRWMMHRLQPMWKTVFWERITSSMAENQVSKKQSGT